MTIPALLAGLTPEAAVTQEPHALGFGQALEQAEADIGPPPNLGPPGAIELLDGQQEAAPDWPIATEPTLDLLKDPLPATADSAAPTSANPFIALLTGLPASVPMSAESSVPRTTEATPEPVSTASANGGRPSAAAPGPAVANAPLQLFEKEVPPPGPEVPDAAAPPDPRPSPNPGPTAKPVVPANLAVFAAALEIPVEMAEAIQPTLALGDAEHTSTPSMSSEPTLGLGDLEPVSTPSLRGEPTPPREALTPDLAASPTAKPSTATQTPPPTTAPKATPSVAQPPRTPGDAGVEEHAAAPANPGPRPGKRSVSAIAGEAMAELDSPPELEPAPEIAPVSRVAAPSRPDAAPHAAPVTSAGTRALEAERLDKGEVQAAVRQVTERLDQIFAAGRPSRVTVRLEPERLGTVEITVKMFGNRIDADMAASHEGLRAALDQHRHHLVQAVEARGFSVNSLTVGADSGTTPHGGHAFERSHRQLGREAAQGPDHRFSAAKEPSSSPVADPTRYSPLSRAVDYRI